MRDYKTLSASTRTPWDGCRLLAAAVIARAQEDAQRESVPGGKVRVGRPSEKDKTAAESFLAGSPEYEFYRSILDI